MVLLEKNKRQTVLKKTEKGFNKNDAEKDKSNVENRIISLLKNEYYLRDVKKPQIYNFEILEDGNCSCDQEIEIKINSHKYIQEDIIKILNIIKEEYNDKNLKNIFNLEYDCDFEQVDINGNVYKFIFNSYDDNYEYPYILAHCYSKNKKSGVQICLHIKYLSILNYYNNRSFDYETHIFIEY